MNAQQRENLRIALLTVLSSLSGRFGLNLSALTLHVSAFGFAQIKSDEVEAEIQYLTDKGLISEVAKTVSPENQAWRINASGRDFLAARGVTNE